MNVHRRDWRQTPEDEDWEIDKEEDHPLVLNAFEDARAAIAALQSSDEWQPIETFAEPTAPSSGNGVLVVDADGTVGEAYYRNQGDSDDGWWWTNTNWGDYPTPDRPNPTHWRPLPAPPRLNTQSGEQG